MAPGAELGDSGWGACSGSSSLASGANAHGEGRPVSRHGARSPLDAPGRLAGWGALVGLAGLVLGIPAMMLSVGAVPPVVGLVLSAAHVMVRPALIPRLASDPLTRGLFEHAAIMTAWLAWSWLLVAVVADVLARMRGRPVAQLPGSRRLQAVVGSMVGSCLAALALQSAPGGGLVLSTGALRLQVRPVAAVLVDPDSAALVVIPRDTGGMSQGSWPDETAPGKPEARQISSSLAPPGRSTPDPPSFPRSYVVKPGDTLWSIAASQLGSPLRWQDLAKMNLGMLQADGQRLDNANWLQPGWVLQLPPAVHVPPGLETPAAHLAVPVANTVMPGLQDGSARVGIAVTTAADQVTPGNAGATPGLDGSTPSTTPSPTPSTTPSPTPSLDGSTRSTTSPGGSAGGRPADRWPAGEISEGILAAGMLALLARMRVAQSRHRREGRMVRLPLDRMAEAERRLRLVSDAPGADWVDLALRAFYAVRLGVPGRVANVVAVWLRPREVELVLDVDVVLTPPFVESRRRSAWILSRDASVLAHLSVDACLKDTDIPLPCLVTIGKSDEGVLLVDLEHAGSLCISGSKAQSMLRAIIVELIVSPWSERAELLVIGSLGMLGGLGAIDRVRHIAELSGMINSLSRRAEESQRLLRSAGYSTAAEARRLEGGDAWDVTVVICGDDVVTEELDALNSLLEIAGDGGNGVIAVVAGAVSGAKWQAEVDEGPMNLHMSSDLDDTGIVWPPEVNSDTADALGELLHLASDLTDVAPTAQPYNELQIQIVQPVMELQVKDADISRSLHSSPELIKADKIDQEDNVATSSALAKSNILSHGSSYVADKNLWQCATGQMQIEYRESVDSEVEICVLGPVEVLGAARPFSRAWSIELIAFLAMHPAGALNDQWSTALWPDCLMATASQHSTVSAARRALGTSRTGVDHLPRSRGRLQLSSTVTTDWDKFVALSQQNNPACWEDALALVRGRPFEGLRSYDWAIMEGITAAIEAGVVDLASRLSGHCLAAGDADRAQWAARQGLRICPYDERLYRVLLRAADLAGNPAGVESVMAELVHLIADDVEPFDAVHPETASLYKSLSRRSIYSR